MRGAIRAMEVTMGPNGFHPHLHVLLLLAPVSPADLDAARQFLSQRWISAVTAILGEDAAPNAMHACDLRPCVDANYLTKLGLALELAAPADKHGRSENRSPFQVAVDFTRTGDETDALLWQAYSRGMKGARMLTWTRGLRAAAEMGGERTDAEIVEGTWDDEETVCSIAGIDWDACRDRRGFKYLVLEAAERGGVEEVNEMIRENTRRPP